jgi:threonine synthase
MCNRTVTSDQIEIHKQQEPNGYKYAMLWPDYNPLTDYCYDIDIPIYCSRTISNFLGVKKVYILDEGHNVSGSMKDYLVKKTLNLAEKKNVSFFNLASSGNHALSLANQTQLHGYYSMIFLPESSSKIKYLAAYENALVIAVKEAKYEEVYNLSNRININGIFNANVSNELLITGFQPVARKICSLSPFPSHILAGVGNGTYLSGLTWSFQHTLTTLPKIVPVGMKGAFPFEKAVNNNTNIYKYKDYDVDTKYINEATGSIALESYNMPQLFYALKISNGFPLGGLQNSDLFNAYVLLMNDKNLINNYVIPEPTGIMGLAAAIKYKNLFSGDDILLISFTGHADTNLESIKRLAPELITGLSSHLCRKRKSLNTKFCKNIVYVNKNISQEKLMIIIQNWMNNVI